MSDREKAKEIVNDLVLSTTPQALRDAYAAIIAAALAQARAEGLRQAAEVAEAYNAMNWEGRRMAAHPNAAAAIRALAEGGE